LGINGIVFALILTICLLRGADHRSNAYVLLAVLGLVCVVSLALTALIGRVAGPSEKHNAQWWSVLSPIWISTIIGSAPTLLIQVIVFGPPTPDALGSSFDILLFGFLVNGIGIATGAFWQFWLWGLLAFGSRHNKWPKPGWWKTLLGALAAIVVLCVIPAMCLTPLLAIGFGVPAFLVTTAGYITARNAMPIPAPGLGMRRASGKVRFAIVLAHLASAAMCAAFNFWWASEFTVGGP